MLWVVQAGALRWVWVGVDMIWLRGSLGFEVGWAGGFFFLVGLV